MSAAQLHATSGGLQALLLAEWVRVAHSKSNSCVHGLCLVCLFYFEIKYRTDVTTRI